MSTIYVVEGVSDESAWPIRAYRSEKLAKKNIEQLRGAAYRQEEFNHHYFIRAVELDERT